MKANLDIAKKMQARKQQQLGIGHMGVPKHDLTEPEPGTWHWEQF